MANELIKDRKKKKGKWIMPGTVLVLALAIGALFVRNNGLVKPGVVRLPSVRAVLSKLKPVSRPAQKPAESVQETREHKTAEPLVKPRTNPAEKAPLLSVRIPDVVWQPDGRDEFTVKISVMLLFDGGPLKQEILLKREDIRVIVLKALAPKKMSGIIVEKLRLELKDEINRLLEHGDIQDIEFLTFEPIL